MPNDDQANKEAQRYLESHLSEESLAAYNEAMERLREVVEPLRDVTRRLKANLTPPSKPEPKPPEKRLVRFEKKISHCYHNCPYFRLDGGPSPVMRCGHSGAPDHGFIISHPDCDDGFPERCPLGPSEPPKANGNG